MGETTDPGFDYSLGSGVNMNAETGIRYGVLPLHSVTQAWCDSSEPDYGEPDEAICPQCGHNCKESDTKWGDSLVCEECGESFEVDIPDCCEPLSFFLSDEEYTAVQSTDGCDIFIIKSPYYTRAQYCSPCAPGAAYLRNPCKDGPKAYCFGHDWFEERVAPYPVYNVETDELVEH